MRILFLISIYQVGDGASAGVYTLIKEDPHIKDYLLICREKISAQNELSIKEISRKEEIINILNKNKYDLIHYIKARPSNVFKLTIEALYELQLAIPIITTVCQRPSYPGLLLTHFELKHTDHFVFIDKASYNDKLISFIPLNKRSMAYLTRRQSYIDTENIPPKKNTNGPIIYGRGSTLNKCPKNMFDIFDRINIPNKIFYIVGIPEGNNWVRKEAAKRNNVKVYPLLPYKEWFELCKQFDISLYQIPVNSYSSIDANLELPMLMQKPTVYYGSAAPKERFVHGINGFVANSDEEIIEYATILGKDEELRHKIGIKAREMTMQMFSYQKRIDIYYRIYSDLLILKKTKPIKIPFKYYVIYAFKSRQLAIQYIKKCIRPFYHLLKDLYKTSTKANFQNRRID